MITRDINDVLESITLKYNDGRVEMPDFYKVIVIYLYLSILPHPDLWEKPELAT